MAFDYDKEISKISELLANMSNDEFVQLMRDSGFEIITKEALRVSKSVTAHSHGHKIYYDGYVWRYLDDDSVLTDRPCVRCGRMPTPEGYDACLGHIEGATSACCGHGVHEGFVVKG